jgi:hypothetical protein
MLRSQLPKARNLTLQVVVTRRTSIALCSKIEHFQLTFKSSHEIDFSRSRVSFGTIKNGGVPNSKEGRSGVFQYLGTIVGIARAIHR